MFESKRLEVTRKCKCGACGKDIKVGDDRTQVIMPWQIRGVNYHTECLENYVADNSQEDTTNIGSSNNCSNHSVALNNCSPIIFQYFIHYGFKGKNGKVRAEFKNAESIGSTLKVAFNNDCNVYVNGKKCKTLEEYDTKTKEICMR